MTGLPPANDWSPTQSRSRVHFGGFGDVIPMVVRVADHFWKRLVKGVFMRGRGVNLERDTDDRATWLGGEC